MIQNTTISFMWQQFITTCSQAGGRRFESGRSYQKSQVSPLSGWPFCVPSMHTSLTGESPERARQREAHSQSQGCPSRGGIRKKREANPWPDEQELHQAGGAGKAAKQAEAPKLHGSPVRKCGRWMGGKRRGLPREASLAGEARKEAAGPEQGRRRQARPQQQRTARSQQRA